MQGEKKDWEASGAKTLAFGTRVPEHSFCVLRFDRAKIYIYIYVIFSGMQSDKLFGILFVDILFDIFF